MAWRVDPKWWARTLRSLKWVLKGRVYLSVRARVTVVVWRPPYWWARDCQVVFPTWCWEAKEQHETEVWIVSLLRKVSQAERSKLAAPPVSDPELEREYPGVHEYLTAAKYPDGSSREVSTLLIFVADGQWKAMLRDKDNGRCLWATGKSFEEALEVLEALLQAVEAPWRLDRSATVPEASRLNGKRSGRGKKK